LSSPKWCLCELVPVGDLEHDPLTVASRAVCARRLARDRARAQLVADEIRQLPEAPAAVSLEADVGDEAAVMAAAAEVDAAWGRVDALVINAGWMWSRPQASRTSRIGSCADAPFFGLSSSP
jgi:NAD(P)-dependent dehydrogenase (short-subunit alcohol dehydrogenase family)